MKRKILVAGAAALAVAGGGAAIAASKSGSPQEESKAVVDDAAKQLGITPAKLSSALKQALENRRRGSGRGAPHEGAGRRAQAADRG